MNRAEIGASSLLALGLAGFLTAALAQQFTPQPPPAPTRAGSYQGTWSYVDRRGTLAFWFDQSGGKLLVRYRYDLGFAGSGDTGAGGTGVAESPIGKGTSALTSTLDADGVIRGHITRRWTSEGVEAILSNDFEAYRYGPKGETLYCVFKNTRRETRREDGGTTTEPFEDTTFNFRKLTDEIVFWEEIR